MTDTSTQPPADPAAQAVLRALDAAQAATDAAHEAEAVVAARSEAATAMARTARNSGRLAGIAAAVSLLALAGGGVALLRATANLHEAAEVQAAAAAGFVERLGALNLSLDRMDTAVAAAEGHAIRAEATLDTLLARVDERLMALASAAEAAMLPDPDAPAPEDFAALRADLLMAIAEMELSLAQGVDALVRAPHAASTQAPTLAPSPLQVVPQATTRSAPAPVAPQARPARAPAANPFRFP